MNRKSNRIILILFALTSLLFMTGCASTQKVIPSGNEMVADRAMMIPPEMKCCNEYNSTYNWSEGNDASCCASASLPDACSECVVNETRRQAEIVRDRTNYRRTSPFERFLLTLPIVLVILTLISVLLLITDKITEIIKDAKEGFLSHRLKRTLQIFILATVGVFIIFFIVIKIFG